jgi:hypothetical protein
LRSALVISKQHRVILTLFFTAILLARCANPVPPLGGDKDTLKPKLVRITNTIKANKRIIQIEFNENIQTKNSLVVSPITKETSQQTTATTNKRKIQITTPITTNTLYLNGYLSDLNENNPVNEPTLLLSNDTGELVVSTPLKDNKIKKHVFIKDINRYQLEPEHTDTSLIYLPTTTDNVNYHFHGLTDSLHLVYVVYEDNDYYISKEENANCSYLFNSYKDTFKVESTFKKKNYKSAFNYKDSLFIITEPTIDIHWFNNNVVHYFYRDTLIVLKANIDKIKEVLFIDSFTYTKKLSNKFIDNREYFTVQNKTDTISVKPFQPFFTDTSTPIKTISNHKNPAIKVGVIHLSNPNKSPINLTFQLGASIIFIQIEGNSERSFFLTEGLYNYRCWLSKPHSQITVSPELIDYTKQIPLNNPDYVMTPIKPFTVSFSLENMLILPVFD